MTFCEFRLATLVCGRLIGASQVIFIHILTFCALDLVKTLSSWTFRVELLSSSLTFCTLDAMSSSFEIPFNQAAAVHLNLGCAVTVVAAVSRVHMPLHGFNVPPHYQSHLTSSKEAFLAEKNRATRWRTS